MYKGVYEGVDADKQSKKILILGESHHSKDGNGDFTTAGVIQHMKRCPTNDAFHFFHKVAKSCGEKFSCTEMEFEMFWNKVYFGNYIEDLCEIKTSTAKNLARDNRVLYNDNLFKFINEKNIDMVLVFSRLVYNSLPSFSESLKSNERQKNFDDGTLKVKSKRDWISHCVYLPDAAHKYTNVLLNKKVDFYGMRHPSARCGYNAENYSKFLHCLFV